MNLHTIYNSLNISFVMTLMIASSCSTSPNEEGSSDTFENQMSVNKKQFDAFGMKVGGLSEQTLYSKMSTRGMIDVPPDNKVSVIPFHGGYIKKIDILPGEKVKKGTVLFTIQNPVFIQMQQDYLEAKEQLIFLEADFERQKTLAEENISSQKNFKKSASDYRVMLAKVAGLKAQLKLINIAIAEVEAGQIVNTIAVYAPISGYITAVTANKGMYIDSQKVAVEITNLDHIHLELAVYEKDVMRLGIDQKILFRVPQSGNESYEGEVHLVGKSISKDQRTVNVHGHIHEEDEGRFIPGMYVEAEIVTSTQTALCLPQNAIIDTDGVQLVLVKIGNSDKGTTFKSMPVSTGISSEGWIEILNAESLKGKEVLVNGAFNLMGE